MESREPEARVATRVDIRYHVASVTTGLRIFDAGYAKNQAGKIADQTNHNNIVLLATSLHQR